MVGTPATQMQSLTAIRFPASAPLAAPAISVTPCESAERIVGDGWDESWQARIARLRQRVGKKIECGIRIERAAHHPAKNSDVAVIEVEAKIGRDLGKLGR